MFKYLSVLISMYYFCAIHGYTLTSIVFFFLLLSCWLNGGECLRVPWRAALCYCCTSKWVDGVTVSEIHCNAPIIMDSNAIACVECTALASTCHFYIYLPLFLLLASLLLAGLVSLASICFSCILAFAAIASRYLPFFHKSTCCSCLYLLLLPLLAALASTCCSCIYLLLLHLLAALASTCCSCIYLRLPCLYDLIITRTEMKQFNQILIDGNHWVFKLWTIYKYP